METKFQKFQNSLSLLFRLDDVKFVKIDDSTFAVRSLKTGMFCGYELRKLIELCDSLGLDFYIASKLDKKGLDFVDFVIYK